MYKLTILLASALLFGCSDPAGKSNGSNATNSSNETNSDNPNSNESNSSGLTDVPPDFSDFIVAYCAYDASCVSSDWASTAECEAEIQGSFELEDCYRYDLDLYEQCVEQLDTTCVGGYENYPQACDDYIDYSVCCEEEGGVLVDGTCEDACESPDDCGSYGYECTAGVCDCPNLEAEINGERACVEECDGGMCDEGFTCRSGVCILNQE